MDETLHYLTEREGRVTKIACDPAPIVDDPSRYGTASKLQYFLRADGRRAVIDEDRVTCKACKATDVYMRNARWADRLRPDAHTNTGPMHKRNSLAYEEAEQPAPSEARSSEAGDIPRPHDESVAPPCEP